MLKWRRVIVRRPRQRYSILSLAIHSIRKLKRRPTFNVERDVVRVLVVLGTDLALVDPLVCRPDVLDYQTPLVCSLVVADADPGIRSERKHANRQRMDVLELLPGHLEKSDDGERCKIAASSTAFVRYEQICCSRSDIYM